MAGGRPTKYKEDTKFHSEKEIVDYLISDKAHIEAIIGATVKKIQTEVCVPNVGTRKAKSGARIDILVIDTEDRWHIFEVKHPKNSLLENSKGIAQLMFYDAMIAEKEDVDVTSMTLVTSSFDTVAKNIVPRNNLKIRLVEAQDDGTLDVIIGFNYKNGRPKEYRDHFVEDVYGYVLECAEMSKEKDAGVFLPTVEGVAERLGFSKETIYTWAKENEDFSDALAFLKNKQCVELINNGLANKYNSTIAKLILSSNHGMSEKTQTDVTNSDGSLKTVVINKANGERNNTITKTD